MFHVFTTLLHVYFVHVWSYFFISSPGHFVRQSVNNSLQNISETTGPNSMKLHGKLPWVTFYKKNTTTLRLNNNNNKFRTTVFAWKNISETTRPKSMKHYRNLHWMTLQNTTRHRVLPPPPTTKWPTFCFTSIKPLRLLSQIQ